MTSRPELKTKNNFFAIFKEYPVQLLVSFVLACIFSWLLVSHLHITPRDKHIGDLEKQVNVLETENNALESSNKKHEPEIIKLEKEKRILKINSLISQELTAVLGERIELGDILLQGGFTQEDTNEFIKLDEENISEMKKIIEGMDERILSLEERLNEKR